MSAADDRTEGKFSDAHEVYAAYVRDRQDGKGVDFEELCTEHADFEGELRKLHSLAELVRVSATSLSFHESIRERLGDVDEVTVSLAPEFSHLPSTREEAEVTPPSAPHDTRYESEGELA